MRFRSQPNTANGFYNAMFKERKTLPNGNLAGGLSSKVFFKAGFTRSKTRRAANVIVPHRKLRVSPDGVPAVFPAAQRGPALPWPALASRPVPGRADEPAGGVHCRGHGGAPR